MWLSGRRIGDYSTIVTISVPTRWLWQSLRFRGTRTDELLAEMPADALLRFLESRIYKPAESIEATAKNLATYGRYCICPNVCESFDGDWLALVELTDADRMVWRNFGSKVAGDELLPVGFYDETVSELVGWIHAETGFHPSILDKHLR